MREFPPAEELQFLVGMTPSQFRVGIGKFDLMFGEACLIVMEHRVSFVTAGAWSTYWRKSTVPTPLSFIGF